MIEKHIVISILEDIQKCLNEKNSCQEYTLSTIKQYRENILNTENTDIKILRD